jgi:hypothetical protein
MSVVPTSEKTSSIRASFVLAGAAKGTARAIVIAGFFGTRCGEGSPGMIRSIENKEGSKAVPSPGRIT